MSEPFRRRMRLRHDGNAVEAEMEDHIHHFAVRVTHDGARVTGVEGRPVRTPWSLCGGAVAVLDELVGAAIGTMPLVPDHHQHCTHLLDVARCAVRFAGDPVPTRSIEVAVHEWETDAPRFEITADPDDGAPEVDLLVRRCTWMARSRGIDLDVYDTLDQSMGARAGVCYASQPQRIHLATRNRGTTLDRLT